MPLFQNSVITKHLLNQDKSKLLSQWEVFKNHFHNPIIQENIRNSKEEQYQGGFLIDLFVNVLGYTKNPTPNFNLTTEYKNVKDSKKTDGAIVIKEKVKAVIELKGTNTTDLNKIENQAFGYKNNQPDCVYVITSNFEKLRFYIDNATEFLEFNLFELNEKEFELLYLCLAYENIANDTPKKIKEQSLTKEKDITKDLYKDYSNFKSELYQDLVNNNAEFDKLILFKKSQKLIDRFLFLFFAEDRQLLPPNSVRLILSDWKDLQERDVEIPLYERFKKYFGYLNTGYKGKRYDVFAYNGGLFKPDEVLDNVVIDDELLYKHTKKLSNYDFQTEVDVNILGHIFENSLNELDEITAQLEGKPVEKSKTKRKKDGVFYTPKYITKYIVDNTVGKLCAEKKEELKINEEEYFTDRKRTKATKQPLLEKLTNYRNWLMQITICDPACGSGAFLNQALEFLISEHRYIDELQAKLFGDAMVLTDIEISILENNLFGVDLNEESVEIAKLSLWLRTAQPNRKLNDLSNNIKCGNSLIDDPEIAGEKAFNWQNEFPHVFAKGGFDVVIGNPPYVVVNKVHYKDYINTYNCSDLYAYFFEKAFQILKVNGSLGFITPSSYFTNLSFIDLRKYLLIYNIQYLIDLGANVFTDASVDSGIIIMKKSLVIDNTILISDENFIFKEIDKSEFKKSEHLNFNIYLNPIHLKICNSKLNDTTILEEIVDFARGVEFGFNSELVLKENLESTHPIVCGGNISRYNINFENRYIYFDKQNTKIYKQQSIYINEKILIRRIGNSIISVFDNLGFFNVCDVYNLTIKTNNKNFNLKYINSLLNSKYLNFYYNTKFKSVKKLFPKIPILNLKQLPIKNISLEEQQPFIEKADLMLSLNKDLQEQSQRFQRTIQRKFELETLPKKLQDWYLLSYAEFIKELAKKKIKLSLSEEAEWEDYFTTEANKVLEIKNQIDTTDKEIDKMVYKLYDLTDEEIEIVENS